MRCLSFYMYFWPLGWWSMSLLAAGDPRGGFPPPKATRCGIFIHMSLWYDLGPKWYGGYPPWEIVMPCDTHIPSIACFFFFYRVVPGPSDPCLSVINSLIPSFVEKFLISLLRMYSLMFPIIIILSPLLFHMLIFSEMSDRKAVLGNSRIFRLEKWVKCWAYT